MLAEGTFGLYRLALDAGLGDAESARFDLGHAGTQVIAYNRTERLVITFALEPCDPTNNAQRFLFVGAALTLSSHFGTLVVPAQAGVRPLFSYTAPGATVHGYRFAISGGGERIG